MQKCSQECKKIFDGLPKSIIIQGEKVMSKSLNIYVKQYIPKYGIRISGKNFGFENGITSVPLYAAFCIK